MAGQNGSNITTKAEIPGTTTWQMQWLNGGLDNFRLDIVGFLALLGEDVVKRHSRTASLSRAFWLPRILPAPHTLLNPEQPEVMETVEAHVYGVHSGDCNDRINYIAYALFGASMRPYEVRCVRIEQLEGRHEPAPLVVVYPFAASIWVVYMGSFNMIGLVITSVTFGDGMSLIAAILLSILSSVAGASNHWKFSKETPSDESSITGDSVILGHNKSFMILKCDESVARQLLYSSGSIDYTVGRYRRMLPLVGALILMLSVIVLANARVSSQVFWAGSYIIVNLAYWISAILPRRFNFTFPNHRIVDEKITFIDENDPESSHNLHDALWRAVVASGSTAWVLNDQRPVVPRTPTWVAWLSEAERVLQNHKLKLGLGRTASREPKTEQPGSTSNTEQHSGSCHRALTWREHDRSAPVTGLPLWDPKAAFKRLSQQSSSLKEAVSGSPKPGAREGRRQSI